jgi:hypothetical protein
VQLIESNDTMIELSKAIKDLIKEQPKIPD